MSRSRFEKRARRLGTAVVLGALLAASPLAAGESKWYVAGKLGRATLDGDFGPPSLLWRIDEDEDSAASVEVGYGLHRNLAVQAGYHDLGTYRALGFSPPCQVDCPLVLLAPSRAAADFTAFSLAAVPRWPVTERFALYGKLGVLDWEGDIAPESAGLAVERPSDRDLLTGIGAQYAFPRGFGLLLEYEQSDLFDRLSLGSTWRF